MKKVRITVTRQSDDPSEGLRIASQVRRDLWAHSPVEVSPDSKAHATRRDPNGRAFFEFATNHFDEVERVIRDFGHGASVQLNIIEDAAAETCVRCKQPVGVMPPTVCPHCNFREISACPHCNHEISRLAYTKFAGDVFRCPQCDHFVRLRFHEPLQDSDGELCEPLVIVEKAQG
jgi:predicted RNA-binding Zn-ribbon protein involved in translation (DUF1610 family)